MKLRPALIPAAATIAVLAIAGCGDSSGSADSDANAAALVPATAPVYIEATIQPDGVIV